jgi:hypothetical protein
MAKSSLAEMAEVPVQQLIEVMHPNLFPQP